MILHFSRFLQQKFNISDMEKGQVYTSWALRFLYQVGFIVSWTVLIALFVERFGVYSLPVFFFGEAVFLLLGTWFASFLFSRLSLSTFFYISCGGVLLCLFAAFLFPPSTLPFLILLLFGKGFFFSQMSIILYRRTEELFSRIQAQRFFSFIETSVTIGALCGAILTLMALSVMPLHFVFSVWAMALFGMAYLVFRSPRILHSIPSLSKVEHKPEPFFTSITSAFKTIPFIRLLSLVLFFQFFLFTLVEIIFVKDVYSHIIPDTGVSFLPHGIDLQASVFSQVSDFASTVSHAVQTEVSSISSRLILNESLAHDLGMFHLIFALFSLIFQIIITPVLLKRLGIIGSFLSFLVLVFSLLVSMVAGYISVNVFRLLHHTTHSVGESSYHMMYYSFLHKMREHLRLFLEGIVKPLAIIAASLFVFFSHASVLLPVGIICGIFLVFTSLFLRSHFTHVSRNTLKTNQDVKEKINAIQVLGQKGHTRSLETLSEELLHAENHPLIRENILQTLSEMKDPEVVHTYIHILSQKDESVDIKRLVLTLLSRLEIPAQYWEKHSFTRHHLLQILKDMFETETDSHIKEKIVLSVFRHLPNQDSAPFFLETMAVADEKLKSIYLRSCSEFQDPAIAFYIRDYLNSDSSRLSSHAVIGLWKFEEEKGSLRSHLHSLLESKSHYDHISALYALGEVRDIESIDTVRAALFHTNQEVRLHACIALLKMNDESSIPLILQFLFAGSISLSKKTFYMLHRVPHAIRMKIQRSIQREVSSNVLALLQRSPKHSYSDMTPSVRLRLRHWYWLSGCYDDLIALDESGA